MILIIYFKSKIANFNPSARHFVILILVTIIFLYVFSTRLNLNENIKLIIRSYKYNHDINNSIVREVSSNCNPIKSGLNDAYIVNIDGENYPKSVPLFSNRSINFECLNQNASGNKIKLIMAWTSYFGNDLFNNPLASEFCPVRNCEITSDKSRLNESDLVLVHMVEKIEPIPTYRPRKQRWVFVVFESPAHTKDYSQYNGMFNLTATYRIESNFSGYYEASGNFEWRRNESFDENADFSGDENMKLAAALISNCGGSSRRLDFIKEMQNYGEVDVYGGCGKKCNVKGIACKEMIAREYKFYLAFENSFCKDYITEKFFETLRFEIVPVVMGDGFYEYYIPKSGYINARNFASPKHLVDYLTYLDNNSTAYNSFFKWRKHISFVKSVPPFSPICNMCIKLHLEDHFGIEESVIQDIGQYWNKISNCKSARLDNLIIKELNFEDF